MKLLRKVLLHTRFDHASRDAAETAVALAKAFDSEIFLIHVLPAVPDAPEKLDLAAIREDLTKSMAAARADLEQKGARVAGTVLTEGRDFQRIIECAEAEAVNLVMVGASRPASARGGGLAPMVERLARRCRKPVWVVKKPTGARFERILCPVDFSNHSARALDNAMRFARHFKSELTVLTVVEPLSIHLGGAHTSLESLDETYLEEHVQKLDRLLDRFDDHDVRVKSRILEGDPGSVIVDVARRDEVDLIVMGSAGRSGLARLFLGSVAGSVLQDAPCSVVTMKSESAIHLELETEVRDLKERFDRGMELLEEGFPRESLVEFQAYVARDPVSPPAWEAMATAYARLKDETAAARCHEHAKRIRETIWKRTVEADARRQHWMWKRQ